MALFALDCSDLIKKVHAAGGGLNESLVAFWLRIKFYDDVGCREKRCLWRFEYFVKLFFRARH
jgi:hypothetical protein